MQSTIGRTPSGHTTAILASKVQGTTVYNAAGESIGHVEDVVLDKMSDRIIFAVVGFGGFLGIGEKYHPLPWAQLDYDENRGGYVVSLTREQLEAAPNYELHDLTRPDGRTASEDRELLFVAHHDAAGRRHLIEHDLIRQTSRRGFRAAPVSSRHAARQVVPVPLRARRGHS